MANRLTAFRRVYVQDPDADALATNHDVECVTIDYMGNPTLESGSMAGECVAKNCYSD